MIDCGNAGTGVRLIMGAAAGFALTATFTGDAVAARAADDADPAAAGADGRDAASAATAGACR